MPRESRRTALALPPPTAEEQALSEKIVATLKQATAQLQQRNLHNAVLLAHQAARGQGPLVDWFAEIGRRFGDTLELAPERPKLRLVKGGVNGSSH